MEQSGSDQVIGLANNNRGVMSLLATSPAPIWVDVKDVIVVLVELIVNCVELCLAAKEAYDVLYRATKSVGLVYIVPFQGLLEAVKQSSLDLFNGVQAVVCLIPHYSSY